MMKLIIRDTFIYGFSSALSGLVKIILLPFYTYLFSPEDYGTIALVTSVNLILSMLMSVSIETAYTKMYNETEDQSSLFSSVILFRVWFGALIYGIYLLFCVINLYTGTINIDFQLLVVSGAIPYTSGIYSLFLLYLRMNHRPWRFLLSNTLISITIASSVVSVVYFIPTTHGYFTGQIFGSVLGIIVAYYSTYRISAVYAAKYRSFVLLKVLKFALPLFPASISQYLNTNADKFIISSIISNRQVGVYEYGNNISSIFSLLNSVLSTAFLPHSMKIIQFDQRTASKLLKNLSNTYIYVILIAWSLFIPLSSFIANILAPSQFHDAKNVISILTLTNIVLTLTYFSTLGSWRVNKSHDYSISIVTGVFTNLIVSFSAVPYFGIIGAAYANLIANIITVLVSFYLSSTRYQYNYSYWHITLQICAAIAYLFVPASIANTIIFCIISTVLYSFFTAWRPTVS